MDGGAELYLEYGFSAAGIKEISFNGQKYKTEIFKMNGNEAAFGIFSVSKFNCKGTPRISQFTCLTKYQFQVCKGPYYISIINSGGSVSDSINMLKIGSAISGKITETEIDLSNYLPEASRADQEKECFLARGRLGIVNGSPDLEDFFAGIKDFSAVVLKQGENVIISVKFDSDESMREFLGLHKWNIQMTLTEVKQMPGGEKVKLLKFNHLYITIPK
jgi:hypothetical protein